MTDSHNVSRSLVLDQAVGRQINFDDFDIVTTNSPDFLNCSLTGTVKRSHGVKDPNFKYCTLDQLVLIGIDLNQTDFNDCHLRAVTFEKCNMDGAGFKVSSIENSVFRETNITLTNFGDSEFFDVRFESCDFSRMLIKGCRFYRCQFVYCKTTNKLFESCILVDCTFEGMELQIQSIWDNFGFRSQHLTGTRLRTARTSEAFAYVLPDDLATYVDTKLLTALQLFSIEYFLPDNESRVYAALDQVFHLESWIEYTRSSRSFALVLNTCAEFLLYLFKHEELPYTPFSNATL
ncbi:MAG: pentapeptide repeat-containing protein [bacterium]|nr:pentapeptide repeat-containing protein [bacterium]